MSISTYSDEEDVNDISILELTIDHELLSSANISKNLFVGFLVSFFVLRFLAKFHLAMEWLKCMYMCLSNNLALSYHIHIMCYITRGDYNSLTSDIFRSTWLNVRPL